MATTRSALTEEDIRTLVKGATAAERAAPDPLTVGAEEPLARAARLMAEHRASHVLVLATGSGRPAGVLSTLDVAALAGRADA